MGLTVLYHHCTRPQYTVTASLLINEDKGSSPLNGTGGSSSLNASDVFQGFGLYSGKQNMENQIQILKSWTLVSKAVYQLNMVVSYFHVGWGKKNELYRNAPFRIEFLVNHPQLTGVTFDFEMVQNEDIPYLTVKGENASTYDYTINQTIRTVGKYEKTVPFHFNDLVITPEFAFRIVPVNGKSIPDGDYSFTFHSHAQLVNYYRSKLEITTVNKEATMLQLKMISSTPARSIDFLDKLMEVYQQQNLDKKNEMATRTIQFITVQLSIKENFTY